MVGVVVAVLVAVLVAVAVEEVVVVGKELPPGGKSTRFETVEVLTSEVREHIRPSKLHNHRFFQSSCGLDCSKRDFACNFDSNLVYMLLGDQAPVWVAVAVVAVAVVAVGAAAGGVVAVAAVVAAVVAVAVALLIAEAVVVVSG